MDIVEYSKYVDRGFIVFSIGIEQKIKDNFWKKDIKFPKSWTKLTLKTNNFKKNCNGLAILTGKVNNIIVLDIDNIEQWNELLKIQKQKEPDTLKVITGSGGYHYYFIYTDDLQHITSKDHAIEEYAIDIKTNGGCVICPPSSYYNKNLKKNVNYQWENDKNIYEYNPSEMPTWIKNLLMKKHIKLTTQNLLENDSEIESNNDSTEEIILKKIPKKKSKVEESNDNLKIITREEILEDDYNNFTDDDIEILISLLSLNRCDNYTDWLNIGMCLHNINTSYILYWKKWSKQSNKYINGNCEEKWKSFKKSKTGFKIGSLIMWCKEDNFDKFDEFMKNKKRNDLILSKFPGQNLILGNTIKVNDDCNYTNLNNEECFFLGNTHDGKPSMYIEQLFNIAALKCKHPDCFGKICKYIHLNRNEMNVFNGNNIQININNINANDELIEFQKINLFDNDELNSLVFKGMNGKPTPYAEILYWFYKDKYMYSENDDWYIYDNHKWTCLNSKNTSLRGFIQKKLTEVYFTTMEYYITNEGKQSKTAKIIKQIINNFDSTSLKEDIMKELSYIYSDKNNKNRDFLKKLNNNDFLIGFNNGVFDLQTFEFRDGKPEDYISINTDYNYVEHHTEHYNELLQFLNDIQPNKDELNYMLTYLSIGLIGNLLELFTILTGSGRNGKSKLVELVKLTFGEYFGSVESQLFTRPRPNANGPDPGLLNLANKKIVIASEPEKNSKLNSGFIKFITGRDTTTLRNCHQNNMINFKANFLTFLICNDIPDCDEIDNAFSKRLRCINFPTEFVDSPKTDNQKKINTSINEKFTYWKQDFMLLLIEYYKNYILTKELKPTENILTWTNKYKEDTDIYLQFLNDNTQISEHHIHTSTLYESFKLWFKINNPVTKIPDYKTFLRSIRKYKKIDEKVRVNEKVASGIKFLDSV